MLRMMARVWRALVTDPLPPGSHRVTVEAAMDARREWEDRLQHQVLDLFSLHPIAPGSPFFHPKGAVVYNTLIAFVRSLYARYGYTEVITPLIYKTELYKQSGHYELFRDDMFIMGVPDVSTK